MYQHLGFLYFLHVQLSLRSRELLNKCLSSPVNQCLYVCPRICVAVKAGGMRIVQKHQTAAVPEPPQKDDDEEEYVTSR